LEIPELTPSAATRSSTLRVDTPCTHASITTAYRARSIRRRRSNNDGKNDPVRNFGIFNSKSPAFVAHRRARCPLRCVVRSSLRSNGAAPILSVASASINCWTIHSKLVRIVSVISPARNASSSSDRSNS